MAMCTSGWVMLVLVVGASATQTRVSPLQKVTQLLSDMLAKAKDDKKSEEIQYAAYQQWCTDTSASTTKSISKADMQIEALQAAIQKAEADVEDLSARVQELEADQGRWKKDQASARSVREKERVDYQATHEDYSESVDALERAINMLKKQDFNRPQAELLQALIQGPGLKLVPLAAKRALSSFLQRRGGDPDPLSYDAPEANSYEFQSGGVIDMLEKLKVQFTKQKRELETEELNSKHAYESIVQDLTDNNEIAAAEVARRSKVRSERQQDKATAQKELDQTTSDRAEDGEYLESLTALCKQKADDIVKRQTLRAGEIETMGKAIEILAGASVAGTAEEHLPSLLQRRHVSFLQVKQPVDNAVQQRVAAFLSGCAQDSDSRLLAMVASKVTESPFGSVKKMIKDLIVKLMEEGTAETEHKGWCDTELSTNAQTRDSKGADVDSLTSKIDQLTSEVAQLAQDTSDLHNAVMEIDAMVAKATTDRAVSKEANQKTVKEAKEAQTALSQALQVLKEFYANAGEATALLQAYARQQSRQTPEADAPASFDGAYKGMQTQNGGVVDFLEVIMSDFSRLEAETTTDEESESEEFDRFMFESRKDKALKQNDIQHKEEKKVDLDGQLMSTKNELASSKEELDAAMAYFEKLKPTCVDSGITYEERVKRREAEMQSLKEALRILTGQLD